MTYFELYDLPETFRPDPATLRAAYHRISRDTHPDFFATAPAHEQQAALDRATLNTDAYRTLADPDRCLAYVLRLHGRLGAEGQAPPLPPAFLAEMMDLNEQLMDLQLAPNPTATAQAAAAVDALAADLDAAIRPTLDAYPSLGAADRPAALDHVLEHYLRRQYVRRLREQVARLEQQ